MRARLIPILSLPLLLPGCVLIRTPLTIADNIVEGTYNVGKKGVTGISDAYDRHQEKAEAEKAKKEKEAEKKAAQQTAHPPASGQSVQPIFPDAGGGNQPPPIQPRGLPIPLPTDDTQPIPPPR